MIAYPDTSFLCALYRLQTNSQRAAQYFAALPEALHVGSPLLFEFRLSTRWQAYLHSKDSTKGFDRKTALASLAKLQANLASGAILIVPIEWADVVGIADLLSGRHTWTQGARGLDIIHVATALHLGATEFLTFDERQRDLAEAEGLSVPL